MGCYTKTTVWQNHNSSKNSIISFNVFFFLSPSSSFTLHNVFSFLGHAHCAFINITSTIGWLIVFLWSRTHENAIKEKTIQSFGIIKSFVVLIFFLRTSTHKSTIIDNKTKSSGIIKSFLILRWFFKKTTWNRDKPLTYGDVCCKENLGFKFLSMPLLVHCEVLSIKFIIGCLCTIANSFVGK